MGHAQVRVDAVRVERTHCHNIDLTVEQFLRPYRATGGMAEEVMEVLEPLRVADNDYLDDIEQLMERALTATRRIDDAVQTGDESAPCAEQERFVREMDSTIANLNAALRQINELGTEADRPHVNRERCERRSTGWRSLFRYSPQADITLVLHLAGCRVHRQQAEGGGG